MSGIQTYLSLGSRKECPPVFVCVGKREGWRLGLDWKPFPVIPSKVKGVRVSPPSGMLFPMYWLVYQEGGTGCVTVIVTLRNVKCSKRKSLPRTRNFHGSTRSVRIWVEDAEGNFSRYTSPGVSLKKGTLSRGRFNLMSRERSSYRSSKCKMLFIVKWLNTVFSQNQFDRWPWGPNDPDLGCATVVRLPNMREVGGKSSVHCPCVSRRENWLWRFNLIPHERAGLEPTVRIDICERVTFYQPYHKKQFALYGPITGSSYRSTKCKILL